MKRIILILLTITCCHFAFGQYQLSNLPIIGLDSGFVNPYNYKIVKARDYNNGSVSCAHPLAALVGANILRRGGNAFDAIIAAQWVLAVVYPGAGNIGGGGFLIGHNWEGKNIAIDYREAAPAKATKDMYLDNDGNVQFRLSQQGHLSVGVPGTVAGLFETKKYARFSMRTLIQPAIDIAEYGFVISEREANGLNETRASFIANSTQPSVYVKDSPWKAGDTLVNKDLAETLKRIRDFGERGFYEGKTAKLIIEEMRQGNGIMTLDDVKNYKAKSRTAITFNYKGYDIVSMPPPSSGGILLCQMMKMIENRNISRYPFQSPQAVQLMVEAERRAFADRATYMGDPDFWKVPEKTLTDNAYIAKRMADYDSTKATPSTTIKEGLIHESDQTTHISVIDKEGNMASVTTTLNGSYGSRTVVGGAGFILNNEMDDFSAKPGTANMYGAVGGKANAIQPNKRMLSSMTPTLVLKNKKPYLVVGTPGGTTIPTSVFQTLVNIIDYKMSGDDAVNLPKFHHQWLPDEIAIEPKFPEETKTALERMGYQFGKKGAIGRTELIRVLPSGKKETIADKRGDDSVAGY